MTWSERAASYIAQPITFCRDQRWEMILTDVRAGYIRIQRDPDGGRRIVLR